MGIVCCMLTLCKHYHHFSITENEKNISNMHLWMVADSRFHPQIGHWLAEGCCAFYSSVSKEHSSGTCIGIKV